MYRHKENLKKYMSDFSGFVFTNNTRIVNFLKKNKFSLIMNIPYLRILHKHK